MYQHGGQSELDFERLGIEPQPVLDFSVNVSPFGVPKPIKELWSNLFEEILHYPTADGTGVKQFYEARFGLPSDGILPGNGSIDLIYDVPRILGVRKALIPQPSFHDYSRACQSIGAEVIDGPLDQLKDCNALFIGNPNNPTGKIVPAERLLQLAEHSPEVLFFVDEAFIHFVDDSDQFTLMRPDRLRDNIVLFHSMTKIYALPGLRLGACISTPKTIAKLATHRAPWMVSRIAERVAERLIDCADYEQKLVSMIHTERERVFQVLDRHDAFHPVRGHANFLLAQWTGTDSLDDLLCHLLEQGIYVRDCRNFPGLQQNWFRIALRCPEENDILLKGLGHI